MRYISTRGQSEAVGFNAAVANGLAPDGGLYLPEKLPNIAPLLERWSAPFPGLFLCYPQQRQMAPALRAFIDAVRGRQAS